MTLLRIDSVTKSYPGQSSEEIVALSDITFACQEKEFVAILGSTGCGKTTLLRLIAGLEQPTCGSILFRQQPLGTINQHVTLVFQQYSLFPWRSVYDNIAFSLELKKTDKIERGQRVTSLISLFGLSGFEHALPHELSGGMQQRVSLARALAYGSSILLLDEPFGALDERTRHRLQEELLTIWQKEAKTILLVTHSIDEAIFCADRILVMRDRPGSIEEELVVNIPRPRNRRGRDFIDLHIKIREIMERIIL